MQLILQRDQQQKSLSAAARTVQIVLDKKTPKLLMSYLMFLDRYLMFLSIHMAFCEHPEPGTLHLAGAMGVAETSSVAVRSCCDHSFLQLASISSLSTIFQSKAERQRQHI